MDRHLKYYFTHLVGSKNKDSTVRKLNKSNLQTYTVHVPVAIIVFRWASPQAFRMAFTSL